jgi:hypothetical protein
MKIALQYREQATLVYDGVCFRSQRGNSGLGRSHEKETLVYAQSVDRLVRTFPFSPAAANFPPHAAAYDVAIFSISAKPAGPTI